MIDLTPLDVRNKRGDFKKMMRGYDPHEVDIFLELAAERLEVLVRENLQLRERTSTLQNQVDAQTGREQAVQDALVTAQELRADIQAQSQREADHAMREADVEARRKIAEAEAEARRLLAEAEAEVRSRLRGIERQLDHANHSMTDLERRRVRFLKEFRGLLERELDVVDVEEGRAPYEERAIDLELGPRGGRGASAAAAAPVTVEIAPGDAAGAPGDDGSVLDFVPDGETPTAASADVMAEDAPGDVPDAGPGVMTDAAAGATPGDVHAWRPEAEASPVAPEGGDPAPSEAPLAREPDLPVLVPDDRALAPSAPVEVESPDSGGESGPTAASAPGAFEPNDESTPPGDVEPGTGSAPSNEAERPVSSSPAAPLRPSAPPAAVPDEPSTLELELIAGTSTEGDSATSDRFPDVPDLETLLAEAGAAEIRPTESRDIAPPPAPGVPPDHVILFDPNDPDRLR